MLEYASMRLRLDCATPTTVPRIIVAAAITQSTGAQSECSGSKAVRNTRANAAKAAAFAAFARVFLTAFEPLHSDWAPVLWVIAAATMILGTVVGVAQSSLKRMLAYSSIAHGGYLILALVAANDVAKSAILFYLLVYAVTNLGAFGIIGVLETADRPRDQVSDFAGLWAERPGLAALMTIFLLSLGGFPPFGGFIGKWWIFTAAMSAGYFWLAIIGVLTSVVSVYFYLRVVIMMYMTPATAPMALPPVPKIAGAALVISAIIVFYLGVLPNQVMTWASASIGTIF